MLVGFVCLAWLYLRKLKLHCSGKYHAGQHAKAMMLSSPTPRRWRRYQVELPVHVLVRDEAQRMAIPGCGTELSRGGMALYAGLSLQPGDPIEIEFQTPSKLQILGIIRDRTGYCYGLEFLTPLPS